MDEIITGIYTLVEPLIRYGIITIAIIGVIAIILVILTKKKR